jgi:predicted DNA-binding antitoxin AbrB/MazE fold protein
MTSKIAAVFDGQVFRPTEPIELPANTRVQITIETLPPDEIQETVSFLQTARSLNLERPSDWSTNVDKYL